MRRRIPASACNASMQREKRVWHRRSRDSIVAAAHRVRFSRATKKADGNTGQLRLERELLRAREVLRAGPSFGSGSTLTSQVIHAPLESCGGKASGQITPPTR